MFDVDVSQVWSLMMVAMGDIFVLLAVVFSFFLLLGSLLGSRQVAARGGAVAFVAIVFTAWIYFQKLASPDMADAANGFAFGFDNGLAGLLLGLATVLWIGGIGLLLLRRLA